MSYQYGSRRFKKSALAAALLVCFAGSVQAQSTTGSLYGSAPAGGTVQVVSETGFVREVSVDGNGRYVIPNLPVGQYTVNVKQGDSITGTRKVLLRVGAGTQANFANSGGEAALDSVTVVGQASAIDVTQVDSRVVITQKDLQRLPIAQSAESIALLAPGAVQGASTIASKDGRSINTVSFGGSGVTENAYYVNGYNSTDPLGGLGGASMPYGSIAQQETYIGGYSAMYGRSQGGVLSQVGRRGTNKWSFGGQVRYYPESMQSSPEDLYFPNITLPAAQTVGTTTRSFSLVDPSLPGKLYRRSSQNNFEQLSYSAYVGGPLIPDRLFFFVSGESVKADSSSTPTYYAAPARYGEFTTSSPKVYAKLDWNINDNNILEFTNVRSKSNVYGDLYSYDFANSTQGAFAARADSNKISTNITVGKFTSYLSDNLTLGILYGRSTVHNPFVPGVNNPNLPVILSAVNQDPAIRGATPITNSQTTRLGSSNAAKIYTHGLRVDVNWRLGDHSLSGGIDNMYYDMQAQGRVTYGAGYWWTYRRTGSPTTPINPALGVGAPNKTYYVSRGVFVEATSSKVDQTAYFIEDAWNITDNFLVKLGVRNDKFVNMNNLGQPYVINDNQWAPRLGFSWDINGDHTSKLYGNAGRYFLALPPSVAIRGASASTNTVEYFNYTGINANGVPTGLTPLGPGPVSSNKEYGVPVDPDTVASKGLKAQYMDEFIIGYDRQLSSKWSAGVKGMYRELKTAIDDYCDHDKIAALLTARGQNASLYDVPGCYIFNPGRTNTFQVNRIGGATAGAPYLLTATNAELGFNTGPKREYMGIDLYVDHAFDGVWSGRIDYTWSRNRGNTEGQVKSDTGQGDTSKTSDWDYGALMEYSDGVLQNDRTHQIKMRGAWQFLPEWMVSGTATLMSGRPKNCIGYYGVGEQNPSPGYGSYYHWCGGTPQKPGSAGRTPWLKLVNLGLQYRPEWAQKKVAFGLDVLNAFNQRDETTVDPIFNSGPYSISNTYGIGNSFTTPRRVVFSISYDY